MAAEELLEVQDRERVTLVERQELAECGIGLDRLLVHEVVGARIRHDALRDRRAADLRVLRLAEERRELVADLDGLREDAGLRLRTLNGLRLALAAAIGLLDDAGRLLLNDLEGRRCGRSRRLERTQLLVELRNRLLERGADVLLLRRRGSDRRRRGGGNNGRRLNGGGLRGLGRLHGLRGRSNDSGYNNRGLNRGNGDRRLGCGLRRLRRRLCGSAHFGIVGGTNCGHGTRVLDSGLRCDCVKFAGQNIKVADLRGQVSRLSY